MQYRLYQLGLGTCGNGYLGCSEDFSVEIGQPNQLIVDAFISDEISCYGESDGELSCYVYGGTENYSFVWSHPSYPWVDDNEYHLQTLGNLIA